MAPLGLWGKPVETPFACPVGTLSVIFFAFSGVILPPSLDPVADGPGFAVAVEAAAPFSESSFPRRE